MLKKLLVIGLAVMLVIGGGIYNSSLAKNESDYDLESLLIEAIENEYIAKSTYEILIELHDKNTTLENIREGEINHIKAIERLFERYGFEIPKDESRKILNIGKNDDINQLGINHEKVSIALYKKLLQYNLPKDVESVFENMLRGSENHLSALENSKCNNSSNQENNNRNRFSINEENKENSKRRNSKSKHENNKDKNFQKKENRNLENCNFLGNENRKLNKKNR